MVYASLSKMLHGPSLFDAYLGVRYGQSGFHDGGVVV